MTATALAWSGVAEGSVVGVATDDCAQALLSSQMQLSHIKYLCMICVFILICNSLTSFASILQYVVCMRCNTA